MLFKVALINRLISTMEQITGPIKSDNLKTIITQLHNSGGIFHRIV